MSEVEGTEELNDENTVRAPAEELVELILTGELHAANQKFNSIIEDKVVETIEEEKHKISQTLFAEDEEEADEGKIPPQFLKGKDKDDDDDSDDDDDDDSDDDDSDSNDSDDDDDDDDDKPKKGKVPPQFAKKDEAVEPVDELSSKTLGAAAAAADKKVSKMQKDRGAMSDGGGGNKPASDAEKKAKGQRGKFERGESEAGNKEAIAKNRAMAAKYGQVRQGIPASEEVEPVDPTPEEHSFDPGEASANVELPKDSFVQSVADHLGGKRI